MPLSPHTAFRRRTPDKIFFADAKGCLTASGGRYAKKHQRNTTNCDELADNFKMMWVIWLLCIWLYIFANI